TDASGTTVDISNQVYDVSPVPDDPSDTYWITFNYQGRVGTYTVTIGPDIRDIIGNLMDQDGDGINGEAEDAFVGTFTITAAADLQVTAASAAASTVVNGTSLDTTFTVTNVGPGTARANFWYDYIYLSTAAVLDPSTDLFLTSVFHNGDLTAGGNYSVNRSVFIPQTAPAGAGFLIFV